MKSFFLSILILLIFAFQGHSQIWNHPYPVYPYLSIGINKDMGNMKGVKSKSLLMFCQDTLSAHFEYDPDGRLIFKADEYGDTSIFGYTDNMNEWVYIFGTNQDTLCKREFKFDESKTPIQIISKYKKDTSVFELRKMNDSIFETFLGGNPLIQVLNDDSGRQRKISKFENGWKTYIKYEYSKDSIQYYYYFNESANEKVIGVFKDSNLVEITTIDLNRPLNTIKRIQYFDKNDNLIEIKSARINENEEFNFQRTDLFKYDSNNRLIQWIQYGSESVFCRIEISYEYYQTKKSQH